VVPAGSLKDRSGNALASDFTLDFFVLAGDADRDGRVTIDDYFRLDLGYANQLAGFSNGDFDYSGVINADDYFLIDQGFLAQPGPQASAPRPAELPPAPPPVQAISDAVDLFDSPLESSFDFGEDDRSW
jgi:hypothetical protein